MTVLSRVAGVLARVFPKRVAVRTPIFADYPLAPSVRVILTLAQQDALAYMQAHATPERTLLAALEDEAVAEHFGSRGANVEALRESLLVALASPDVARQACGPTRSQRLVVAMGHALERMRRRGAKLVSRGDLLAGLASTEGETSRLLAGASVEPARLDDEPESKLPAPATDEGDGARVAVYVLNDDVSTMGDVMRVIEQGFELPVRTAFHRMMTTHVAGHARIGAYPRAVAELHLARAKRHADARGCKIAFFVGRA